jgi:hypothetical protein
MQLKVIDPGGGEGVCLHMTSLPGKDRRSVFPQPTPLLLGLLPSYVCIGTLLFGYRIGPLIQVYFCKTKCYCVVTSYILIRRGLDSKLVNTARFE